MRVPAGNVAGAVIALAVALAPSSATGTSGSPERGIRLVNPYPATGPVDIAGSVATNKILRLVQDYSSPSLTDVLAWHVRGMLDSALGEPVALERRARGRTLDAHARVARSAPDGRTLILSGDATMVIYPKLYRELPFDPSRDLVPVTLVAHVPIALVTTADHPAASLAQFLARAAATPAQRYIGSAGDFSAAHLTMELLRKATKAPLEHVAYNGGLAAVRGVVSRQVEAAFVPLPAVLPFVSGGRIRILAVAEGERHPALPDVPTFDKAGVGDLKLAGWYGLFTSGGTPETVISGINRRIAGKLSSEQTRRILLSQGLRPARPGAEELTALMREDSRKLGPLIERLHTGS